MRILNLIILTIFTGSVFLTSDKFVNATNTPKLYFGVVTIFILVAIAAIFKKQINLTALSLKTVLWGIFIICFFQASYGLFQFSSWLPSNHSQFSITGSFDNPAGFAAVLAMGFPIGLYLLVKTKKVERYFVIISLVVIALAIFLSGSRTGMLAILISLAVFSVLQTNILSKFRQLRYYKLLSVSILISVVCGVSILYHQKRDSANGRLLIWKVSSEMVTDKPVFGHGYGSFQAKYMAYQAEYFMENPDSKYFQLADNVKHPFNEFVKIAVEFGVVGLAIILSFILFGLWKIIKSKNENKALILSGLASFLVFACFSYPLQYVAVWLLLAFYLLSVFPSKKIEIKNSPITRIARGAIVVACVCVLFIIHKQIRAEIKWKTIAINSLRGNTEKMLPEYEKLYSTSLKRNSFFLYNYGAELNFVGRFDKSINVLTECEKHFNDYDLQMLLADNYHKAGEPEKAILIYEHASNMIPCRFLPMYNLFEIYKGAKQKDMAEKYANEIINKKVKIPSSSVSFIKSVAKEYLLEIP